MKQGSILLGLVVALILGAGRSQAIQFSDYDVITQFLSGGASYVGQFSISSSADDGDGLNQLGYNPSDHQIISAVASFTVLDVTGAADTVSVDLGSSAFVSGSSRQPLYGMFIVLGGEVIGSALLDLSEDGIISYRVRSEATGDGFLLSAAGLTVQAAPRSLPVPDGGTTIWLMGLSILGLGWLGRKRLA